VYSAGNSLRPPKPGRQRCGSKASITSQKVFLNGQLLGEHEGYADPFEFEVGPLLQPHQSQCSGGEGLVPLGSTNGVERDPENEGLDVRGGAASAQGHLRALGHVRATRRESCRHLEARAADLA